MSELIRIIHRPFAPTRIIRIGNQLVVQTLLTGPQGIQGVQGEKGDTGDAGIQGIQGIPGNDGADGRWLL